MLTAIPPSITQAEAIALTGSDEAPRLLEYLYRRHLFTDRRRGAQTSYHYHALFREFLLEELRSALSARRAARGERARRRAPRRARAGERSAGAVPRRRRMGGDAHADPRQRARMGAPGPRAGAVRLDRGAAASDARGRSVARILVRPRVDLRRSRSAAARRSSAPTKPSAPPAICAARRSRSTRSSPATTTSGRTSRRSIAGCPSSSACSARQRAPQLDRESELRARAALR